MYAQSAEPKLELPKDLLTELQRRGSAPRTDMRVDGWRPSFLGRLMRLFEAKREE